ncbi:MAG: putative Ca2+-binding protein [Parcubacteria group bacterium Licking1014_17]|nr:MAG: putative Ca2+-binding protein [Parcubacteria group bacterium Licking1014_17]
MLAVGLIFVTARNAGAAKPSDYGLTEGNTISAAGSSDPDVYIVNDLGFKRLFLNPAIFGMYAHLGGFANVKNVTPTVRDAFPTSGLYRNCETNAQQVWAVEVTGEDTGVFHPVQMTGGDAVAQDPDFFKKVFCINTREESWYPKSSTPYTSLSQIPVYTRTPGSTIPPVAGNVNVALSPDTPAGQTVTKNAQGIAFTKIRLTGTGTVSSITITRNGAGSVDDIDNVYIYDGSNRLTSGKSLSSSTGKVTFVSLGISVNGTKDLTVKADLSATGGNVNHFDIVSSGDVILSSGTLGGYFPIVGANFTMSGSDGGTLTVAKSGSLSNPNVGAQHVKLSEFKITTATEAGWVRGLRLINNGTVKDADITGLALETGGSKVADGYMSNGYVVFDLGSGVKIEKGNNKIFQVYGNLGGKKAETVELYFELNSDVYVVGDQYGFGMALSSANNGLETASDADAITLQGGVITLSFSGPSASNIADNSQDNVLLEYTINAAKAIELKKHRIVICTDINGDGTYDDYSAAQNVTDLEDIKVKDKSTGTVFVGPSDGSAFIAITAACPGSKNGLYKDFTDTMEMLTGETKTLQVTADLKTSNSGTLAIANNSIIKAILYGYGTLATSSGDLTVAKYSGTNTAVVLADFSPSGDISGNAMTVSTSSLTLGLAGDPKSSTYVKGTANVDLLGLTFKAALGSSLKVTDITLTGYVSDDNSTFAKSLGLSDADATMSVGNLVSGVKLYDGDAGTALSCVMVANNLSSSTSTIQFNNCNWSIPAGATKKLLVKGDLSTNTPSSTYDGIAFNVAATTDITALDDSSQTVNADATLPNGAAASPTVKIRVNNTGSMTISLSPSTPSQEAKYWGQTGTEFSRFRLTSTNEAFYIERFTLIASASGESTNEVNNVNNISVTYTDALGNLLTQSASPNSAGSVSFAFAGTSRPYIPKDSSADLIVKADLKTKSSGATNNVAFSIDFSKTYNGSTANGFRAIGAGSSQVIDGASTGIIDAAAAAKQGNNMYVYRVFPKLDQVAISAGEPLGTKDVLKFTITAMGLSDSKLYFDNLATGSGSIKFEAVASGDTTTTNLTATTYDMADGSVISSDTISAVGDSPSYYASLTLDFGSPGKDVEISGGTSKTFRIEVGFSGFNDKSDYFQLILRDDVNGLINWVADSAGSLADADTASTTSTLRLLPMNGPTLSKL